MSASTTSNPLTKYRTLFCGKSHRKENLIRGKIQGRGWASVSVQQTRPSILSTSPSFLVSFVFLFASPFLLVSFFFRIFLGEKSQRKGLKNLASNKGRKFIGVPQESGKGTSGRNFQTNWFFHHLEHLKVNKNTTYLYPAVYYVGKYLYIIRNELLFRWYLQQIPSCPYKDWQVTIATTYIVLPR